MTPTGLMRYRILSCIHKTRTTFNRLLSFSTLLRRDKLHIGCGDVIIPGHINVDSRPTRATDLTCDCIHLNLFPDHSFSVVYSNAFLEHVYHHQRIPCLQSIRRVLKPDGYVLCTGIPDFRLLAQCYLTNSPGITRDRFDLEEVYRYTHGFPEGKPEWWLSQLHKSLFDTPTTAMLLDSAGFPAYCIFTYIYGSDTIKISQGFIAWKTGRRGLPISRLRQLLSEYPAHANLSSLTIEKQTVP